MVPPSLPTTLCSQQRPGSVLRRRLPVQRSSRERGAQVPSGKLGPLQEQLSTRSLEIKEEEEEDDRNRRRLFCFSTRRRRRSQLKKVREPNRQPAADTWRQDVDTSCQCVATSCQCVPSEKSDPARQKTRSTSFPTRTDFIHLVPYSRSLTQQGRGGACWFLHADWTLPPTRSHNIPNKSNKGTRVGLTHFLAQTGAASVKRRKPSKTLLRVYLPSVTTVTAFHTFIRTFYVLKV